MTDRWFGALLFLPVPLVLILFTRLPFGVGISLSLGVALVATHRSYARPFALARAARRCLYCGGPVSDGKLITLAEPLGTTLWKACEEPHATSLGRVFGWAERNARRLQVGILGTLAIFLMTTPLAARGWLGPLIPADAVAFFRLGVASTVLPLGWLSAWRGPLATEPRVPFPVHIQALIGTAPVLWLFRLIGLLWLGQGLWHLAHRLRELM
jgi:hypothetical protein